MKHATKIVLSTTSVSLVVMFLLSLAMVPSDAAAILDTPHSAEANIGNSFSIHAMGEALSTDSETLSRALTKMHIEFTIIQNGTRGVLFLVHSGSFVMNYTSFTFLDGFGIAGRPVNEPWNRTIVFGFRINFTGNDGELVQIAFKGFVRRSDTSGPILFMRGKITLNIEEYYLGQRGTINRLET